MRLCLAFTVIVTVNTTICMAFLHQVASHF